MYVQVRDLTEKVETLRVKRMQDKERMKDFEKIKLQMEQLLEFKVKVMESQVSTYVIYQIFNFCEITFSQVLHFLQTRVHFSFLDDIRTLVVYV